jgi:hypothetical protein
MGAAAGRFGTDRLLARPVRKGRATDSGNTDPGISRSADYPDPLTKEEVAAKAGYEANGGGFNNALGRLRALELVQGRGKLRASNQLFDSSAT